MNALDLNGATYVNVALALGVEDAVPALQFHDVPCG